MSDPKTFPSVEPPPSPLSGKKPTPSPMDVMEPQPIENSTAATSAQTPSSPQVNQGVATNAPVQQMVNLPPKKGIPKPLIFIVIGAVLIIGILSAIMALRNRRPTNLVGTKGEITWWGMEDKEIYEPLIAEFLQKNPNVRIKYEKQSQKDYRERLTSVLASGTGPDIFTIHNSWVPMFKNDLAPLPGGVMSKDEYGKSFYPVVVKDFTNASGIVAIPLEYDALALFINEDIFTSALKTPPKTWDDLNNLAKTKELTIRGQNGLILQSGVALGQVENVDHWPEVVALMMLQNGADLSKPGGSHIQDAIGYYVHFSKLDQDWDLTLPPSTTAFARSKLAMYFAPTRRAFEITQMNPSLKFRTVILPQLQKENPSDPDISYATYWAQGVWNRSTNSELAWQFLKFLTTPESLQSINRIRKERNLFEVAYPRPEMAALQKDDKILGSIIALAPVAKSWYLASSTFDGETGINSQMAKVFEVVVNAALGKGDINKSMVELPASVTKVIAKYNTKK